MKEYKINSNTLAIIPIGKNKTKIYESNNVIIVEENVLKIMDNNCQYYGSSLEGRKKGTSDLIGVTHKSPIVIEDTHGIIFFPTCSPRLLNCGWISLNNIDSYSPLDNSSIIKFRNNLTLNLPISNKIVNNQVLRATRLESVMMKRKKQVIAKKR